MRFPWRTTIARTATAATTPENVVHVALSDLLKLSRPAAGIDLRARRVRARQSGGYLAPAKGRGMEFDEARPYQPGDEVRHLDWRVTARSGKPHTKLFREERERPVFIGVDYRAPMFFATRGAFKSVVAARAAGLLAWSATHHNDRVAGAIFSEQGHTEFRPRPGRSATLRLLKQLAESPPTRKGAASREALSLSQALSRIQRLVRPGSLICLLSDFRGLEASAEARLARLAVHNEVMMVFIHDPLEEALPPAGHYRLSDGEQQLWLHTGSGASRRAYQDHYTAHVNKLQGLAQRHRMAWLDCATHQNPVTVLQTHLPGRRRA